jgi:alpha-beta hydrolase superfamily lysophospholipase
MSANPDPGPRSEPSGDMADALYFDSGVHRLFGWYHRPPPDKTANFGVVVCKPFGYEAICAHRSVRAFSEAAARLGAPTLRFDYAGTGDSSEIDPQADQFEIWIQDVIAAVGELRRLGGVHRVYLLGFRLGALLATLAAARCSAAVAGLVLVAPILSGRRYVRELRTMRLAASIGSESTGDAATADAGFMEVSGFVFSAATMAAFANVSLKLQGMPSSADLLVIDGTSMPVARAWSEELRGAGVRATYLALPGLVEMLMTAPHFASIPTEMIGAMHNWFTQLADGSAAKDGQDQGIDPQIHRLTDMDLPPAGSQGTLITERPLFLTSETLLFGIVTEPAQGATRHRAVILINAGADYHIGPSAMYVALARRWARSGCVVLRMDLGGIGDSGTRPGRPDNEVFPPEALDDIRAAVEWLRSRYGVRDITLGGLCSGAYHTLQAAVAAIPVNRAVMVNPETFFWREGMSIYDRQTAELVRQPSAYRSKMLSAAVWKRLLSGRINVRYVFGTYAGRIALALGAKFRNVARGLRIVLPNDLGLQLEETAARGVRLIFVFSRGEPGIDLLQLQGGTSLKRLADRCRIHIIDNADHVFSKMESRMALERILSDELFAPPRLEESTGR